MNDVLVAFALVISIIINVLGFIKTKQLNYFMENTKSLLNFIVLIISFSLCINLYHMSIYYYSVPLLFAAYYMYNIGKGLTNEPRTS